MNLADSIRIRSEQPVKLAENATDTLWVETVVGRRLVLKRHRPELMDLPGYAKCWVAEQETINQNPHANLLRPVAQSKDRALEMEHLSLVPLAEFMADNPAVVLQAEEMERIIHELMNVLEHLHNRGLIVIDLNPHNLLLTRSGRAVKLISIGSPYLSIRQQLWPDRSDYLAPELMQPEATITPRADIFALGKIIEFIYSYGQMPAKYKAVVKRCQHPDPSQRYLDIASMRKAIATQAKWKRVQKYALITAGVAAIGGVVWLGTMYESTPFVNVAPALNSDNTISVINARQQYGIDDEALADYIQSDSTITDEQWAISDSIKGELSNVFRLSFRRKATPIIHRIYNQQVLNSTGVGLQATVMQGFEDLKRIKDEVVKETGLDEITADRIAAEVISEIAEKKLELGE